MSNVKARPRATRGTPSDPIAALLTPEGVLSAEGERQAAVSDEQLRQLYRLMVVCRHLDQEALNLQRHGERVAVLVSFGDGATSTGDCHEAMNFAGVFGAPVLFFCENNHWAISVPLREQVAGRIADRAAGYGFPGVRIDGTDALSVYAIVRAAAERIRNGQGPYLIEEVDYRFGCPT